LSRATLRAAGGFTRVKAAARAATVSREKAAGGLIFAGDDQGFFTGLDAETGKPLWHFNTGTRISASPISYAVNGRQYLAVTAGVNVVAFALPTEKGE